MNLIENIHFNVNKEAPEGMSEIDKVVQVAFWWHKFIPEVRKDIIEEKCKDMHSTYDGILGALLLALEQIDIDKLYQERNKK